MIRVPGIPAPQGSKRHVGHGVLIESSRSVGPWRERVALHLVESHPSKPRRDYIAVHLTFCFPRPKSHFKKDGTLRASAPKFPGRPDIDKLVRAILDAMTGIVFVDDSQVIRLTATKVYDTTPGVDIDWIWVVAEGNEADGAGVRA
ncbi:MAG: hypothetical protein KatS3mg015_2827 [Fimbriimonadales bacterium]|nr:MAG: hypothetical protein KatS3mg015_2827 [Fimbriimonadales bacterium]